MEIETCESLNLSILVWATVYKTNSSFVESYSEIKTKILKSNSLTLTNIVPLLCMDIKELYLEQVVLKNEI